MTEDMGFGSITQKKTSYKNEVGLYRFNNLDSDKKIDGSKQINRPHKSESSVIMNIIQGG